MAAKTVLRPADPRHVARFRCLLPEPPQYTACDELGGETAMTRILLGEFERREIIDLGGGDVGISAGINQQCRHRQRHLPILELSRRMQRRKIVTGSCHARSHRLSVIV